MSAPAPTAPPPVDERTGSGRSPASTTGGRLPRVAAALVAVAALAAAGSVAIMRMSGAMNRTVVRTTVVERTTRTTAGAPELLARQIFARDAGGVVDITARVTRKVQTPYGEQRESGTDTGAGSVIDRRGHILTAEHVVAGASKITVKLLGGAVRVAHVLGKDTANDVAVLKIDPRGLALRPIPLGTVATLAVGDPLYVIGDPFGYPRSFSSGMVSAVNRTIQAPNGYTVAHAIQTDAALNPGNSGGPVLDSRARIVGVADQIATGGTDIDSNTGVGFAVAIDTVASSLPDLERGVVPMHAYIGIGASDAAAGARIDSLTAKGPAARAGLRAGDRIVSIGGARIASVDALVAVLAAHRVGDRVSVAVVRGGVRRTFRVVLGAQPSSS